MGFCWGFCPPPPEAACASACSTRPPAPLRAAVPTGSADRGLLLGLLLGNGQAHGGLPRSLHLAPAAAPNMDVISVLFTFRQQIENGIGKQCSACPKPARHLPWTACSAQHVPPRAAGDHLGDAHSDKSLAVHSHVNQKLKREFRSTVVEGRRAER